MPRKPEGAVVHDLLAEPLFGLVRAGGVREKRSLPEVLELLGKEDVRSFTALQAHQQHAWHAFLVQLAAIALQRAGEEKVKQRADAWREMLLAMTGRRREPWCLVVEDLSRPAFMQPPVPEGSLKEFSEISTPDELDLLVTAKNHDVKGARIGKPLPEHWVHALVSLQTMEGFSGRDNYGIARMNGGFASRPGIGLASALDPGSRFRRDVSVLLESRESIARGRFQSRGGRALLWLEEWDGKRSLAFDELDPAFVEVCRRVRFVELEGRIAALCRPTKVARVDAKAQKGNTGDPWTPIEKAEGKAFTASGSGFDYRVTQELLLGKSWAPGAALELRSGEGAMLFTASVLARGQGETNGFHQRIVPLPPKITSRLRKHEAREILGELARARIEVVATVKNAVLKPAILTLLQGDPAALKFKDERGQRWLDDLDRRVDALFFERLWSDAEIDPIEADRAWAQLVLDLGRRVLREALDAAPTPAARRYRAMAAAERIFEGAARKRLAQAFDQKEVQHGT